MNFTLANLLQDTPPSHVFELSEVGLSFARVAKPPQVNFEPLAEGVLTISPVHDNIQRLDALQEVIQSIAPSNGHRKRRAALILPDYCARVAVLDFDAFPAAHEEQLALVRFRMKKSVPFDVDSATVGYYAQPRAGDDKKIEVVVAVMALEIVSRYEAPFRAGGFQPGLITTSAIAALNLVKPDKLTLLAKLSGRSLTVFVLDHNTLKLARCVEMETGATDEVESILHPTLAYIEDELKTTARRMLLCGFGVEGESLATRWQAEWGVDVEPLRSRLGTPGVANAGLLGYLESVDA